MDFYVILLTGSICFVCTVLFKLIMKKAIVNMKANVSDKTLAAFVYILVFIFCVIIYSILLSNMMVHSHDPSMHFKLCYVIKAWTIAVSLNAVYEHFFSESQSPLG